MAALAIPFTAIGGETIIKMNGQVLQSQPVVLYIHYDSAGSFAVTSGPRPGMQGETRMDMVKAPKGVDENDAKEWLVKAIGGAQLQLVERKTMNIDGSEFKEKRLILPDQTDLSEKMDEWGKMQSLIKESANQ